MEYPGSASDLLDRSRYPDSCYFDEVLVFELSAFPEREFLFEVKEGKQAKRRRTPYVEHSACAA